MSRSHGCRGFTRRDMLQFGGLGLSVVRWVSETHGGSVRLLDQSPGAAFEVLLPLAPPQDRAAS